MKKSQQQPTTKGMKRKEKPKRKVKNHHGIGIGIDAYVNVGGNKKKHIKKHQQHQSANIRVS